MDNSSDYTSTADPTPRDTPEPESKHAIKMRASAVALANAKAAKARGDSLKQQRAGFAASRQSLVDTQARDKARRDKFLLGLTELFRHFISGDAIPDVERASTPPPRGAGPMDVDTPASPSRRHRLTEAAEDEELIRAEREPTGIVTHFDESPTYIQNGVLRDYQLHGLNWLISLYENGINGILADEMGLGKTIQVISFLGYLKYFRDVPGPHLVIVPKSTLHNWKSEFARWTPDFNTFILHGDKAERAELVQTRLLKLDFEVCITSYEICLLEKTHFTRLSWQYLVIDEAHRIKNENSKLSEILREFQSKNRLLVTGTPLQNNLHELWALLNFLLPDVFNSAHQFDSWFESNAGEQDKIIQQLHKVLAPFLLRRVKADVERTLLPKKEINLYVGMSSMQRRWYQKLLEKDIEAVNGLVGGKKEGKTRLLNIVMQLRKCCNHPYLFDGAEPGPPYTTDMHLVENSGKMVLLDKLLAHMKAKGSRVLLFSQMSRVLDIMEDYCGFRGYEYCRIDGNTDHADRIAAIDEYNRPGSSKFIFLLTTRAGGLGINLVTADIVIIFDSDWNPQVDLQAMDRAHRIGQTKQVYVFRLLTENSVEDKVLEKAIQKLRLDQLVIQQGRAQQAKITSKDELLGMIQHGAETIFKSVDSTIEADDIEAILTKGETKTLELKSKYESLGLDDLQRFTTEGVGSASIWQGEDYAKKRRNIGLHWIQPAKRERKSNYAIDAYYREAMRVGAKSTGPKQPRAPKQAIVHDFQFYPERFIELQDRENYWVMKQKGYKVPLKPAEEGGATEEVRLAEQADEQHAIDNAVALTEEEKAEKDALAGQGFEEWSRRDMNAFVRGCERYGRDEIGSIAADVDGKSLDEVATYSKVFWARHAELADHEKIISGVEKGEEKIRRQRQVQEYLSKKVQACVYPLHQLKIPYNVNRVKNYTEEEDRFLVVMMEKYGYGNDEAYGLIRQEIRHSDDFRFDWFLKSRTSAELGRRCNALVAMFEKEMNGAD